jgi:hypothetical protein
MDELQEWQSDYEFISTEMGKQITKRKIRKLAFTHDGKIMVAEVGKPNPYNGFAIRKIYASWAYYLLCGGTITIAPRDSLVEEY